MVIAPAKTGRDKTRRIAVTTRDQTNKGIRSARRVSGRILKTVVRKFREPRIEEAPARCKEKIARSTEGPLCAVQPANGG